MQVGLGPIMPHLIRSAGWSKLMFGWSIENFCVIRRGSTICICVKIITGWMNKSRNDPFFFFFFLHFCPLLILISILPFLGLGPIRPNQIRSGEGLANGMDDLLQFIGYYKRPHHMDICVKITMGWIHCCGRLGPWQSPCVGCKSLVAITVDPGPHQVCWLYGLVWVR